MVLDAALHQGRCGGARLGAHPRASSTACARCLVERARRVGLAHRAAEGEAHVGDVLAAGRALEAREVDATSRSGVNWRAVSSSASRCAPVGALAEVEVAGPGLLSFRPRACAPRRAGRGRRADDRGDGDARFPAFGHERYALWAKVPGPALCKLRPDSPITRVGLLRQGGMLIGFVWPAQNPELMQQLAAKGATVLAIDALPRQLSRAEDGRADLHGRRERLPRRDRGGQRLRPLLQRPDHRRAGKIPPAKVFIAGAGVGLAAIGTAAGLGAIVRANDTAPRWPTRWSRWAASSSRSTTRKKARAAAATPR